MAGESGSSNDGGCFFIVAIVLIVVVSISAMFLTSSKEDALKVKYVELRLEVFGQKMDGLEAGTSTNTNGVFSDLTETVDYVTLDTNLKVAEALTRMERYLAARSRYNEDDWARLNELKVELHDKLDDEESR